MNKQCETCEHLRDGKCSAPLPAWVITESRSDALDFNAPCEVYQAIPRLQSGAPTGAEILEPKVMRIVDHGIPFIVKVVQQGDYYGSGYTILHAREDPLVEFYDERYKFCCHGQLISRYFASTLMQTQTQTGINLYGGVQDWYLSRESLGAIRQWLKPMLPSDALVGCATQQPGEQP